MKLVIVTEVQFEDEVIFTDGQLEDLSEHISDEVGSKLLRIAVRDGGDRFVLSSIGTEAKVVGGHSEVMVADEDYPEDAFITITPPAPFYRADGNADCAHCHKPLRAHPAHRKFPELTILCGGQAVKL